MLGKLLKYDIRSTWRDFVGIYLAILLGVIFLPLLFAFVNNAVANIVAGFLIMGIIIATIVITIIMLFKIFNTNIFSKEGYLTMTLPVRGSELVVSKLVVSTMWIVLTGLVSFIGICVFVWNVAPMAEVFPVIRKAMSYFGGKEYFAIALFFIAVIASILKEIAKLFLACSIAHLKQLGRFRVPLGIISFFVLSWLELKVIQVASFIAGQIPGLNEYMRQLKYEYTIMARPEDILQATGLFNLAMAQWILYSLAITTVLSVGTVWLLNHKLELD